MIVFLPRDPFDLREARRIAEEIRALPPDVGVRIDLTRVRDVHPTALAGLAHALEGNGRVGIVGLRRHHERLLAYLLQTPRTTAPPRLHAGSEREADTASAREP